MFENLDGKTFDMILADPPWQYNKWPARGNASNHYPTMTPNELLAMPVSTIAKRDSVLLMWTTGLKLPEAIELMQTWGFTYKGVFCTWVKTTKAGDPAMSCGFYTRSGSEFVIFGIRGKPTELRRGGRKDVRQVLLAERTRHSAKPAEVHIMARDVFPGATSRLELFARRPAAGWTVWGNEVGVGMDIDNNDEDEDEDDDEE